MTIQHRFTGQLHQLIQTEVAIIRERPDIAVKYIDVMVRGGLAGFTQQVVCTIELTV